MPCPYYSETSKTLQIYNRVEMLELDSGNGCFELPIAACLIRVSVRVPGSQFVVKRLDRRYAPVAEALY
jgi:hypothetical protein